MVISKEVKRMVYGYCRVSTKGQEKNGNSIEAQEQAVREAGATEIYSDAFTGTTTDRPELTKLLDKIGKGDKLIVTKLDRIARSATQGEQLVKNLIEKGATIHILNMGTLDNTANGKLIRQIFFAFAEFERDMIIMRTQEGKAIAREKPGFKEGRPKKFDQRKIDKALDLLESNSYSEVVSLTGISKATLVRERRKRKASAAV